MPDKGYPAQFAFQFAKRTVTLYVNVNHETNYGVRVITRDIPAAANVVGVSVTFFGTPVTDPHLDNQLYGTVTPEHTAFLDNPASCAVGPQVSKIYADTWQRPGQWTSEGGPLLSDPNWARAKARPFPRSPGVTVAVRSRDRSPAGHYPGRRADRVTVHLHVPQANQEEQAPLVTPSLQDATVTLPNGVSISPSAADGLQACSRSPDRADSACRIVSAGVCDRDGEGHYAVACRTA